MYETTIPTHPWPHLFSILLSPSLHSWELLADALGSARSSWAQRGDSPRSCHDLGGGDDWEDGPQKIVSIGEKNYRNSRFK